MEARRVLSIVVACLVTAALAVVVSVAWADAPAGGAPAAGASAAPLGPPATTVLEGFESPQPVVNVSTDNLDALHGKPYVALKKVGYVPGQSGNAMKVDFSIIGGYWQNVMVKLNQGVPWNLTGQTSISVTMKGDWADTKGAQSVSLMAKMLNGSFWGVSFARVKLQALN